MALLQEVEGFPGSLNCTPSFQDQAEDSRRLLYRLLGEGLPWRSDATSAGPFFGRIKLEDPVRIALISDLAHQYICAKQIPFTIAATRYLLGAYPVHALAGSWRELLAWLEKEQAAGRPGGCRYDF